MRTDFFKKPLTQLLVLNLFTSGHCTVAQIALSLALSYIFSNSVLIFAFFTGLYLMAMGLGVVIVERLTSGRDRLIRIIFLNSVTGVLLANPGILGVLFLNEFVRRALRTGVGDASFFLFPAGIVLSLLIGLVSGAELPLFSKLAEKEKWPTVGPVIKVLTSDYGGAFLGIMLFTYVLNPFLGLILAVIVSQLTVLAVLALVARSFLRSPQDRWLWRVILGVSAYVFVMLLFHGVMAEGLDLLSV